MRAKAMPGNRDAVVLLMGEGAGAKGEVIGAGWP